MTNLDKLLTTYARLPEDASQDESDASNPFVSYNTQKPYAPADLAQQMQQLQAQPQAQFQGQGATITMMIGNSPQQVLLPPGFALVPGPNGQLTLQQFPQAQPQPQTQAQPKLQPQPQPQPQRQQYQQQHQHQQQQWQAPVPGLGPVQGQQFGPDQFDEGWFLALKVWLIILMISACGSALFWIITGITYDEGGVAVMCLPQVYLFYCLLVLFQAMASKSYAKAKLAWMLLSILQIVMILSYIILVTALVYAYYVGAVSGGFFSFLIIFDATVYFGSYQVKKALEGNASVYQPGQTYQTGPTYQTGQPYQQTQQTGQVFQA